MSFPDDNYLPETGPGLRGLRDYFAAKAMQSMILSWPCQNNQEGRAEVAHFAYAMADAMIAERAK